MNADMMLQPAPADCFLKTLAQSPSDPIKVLDHRFALINADRRHHCRQTVGLASVSSTN